MTITIKINPSKSENADEALLAHLGIGSSYDVEYEINDSGVTHLLGVFETWTAAFEAAADSIREELDIVENDPRQCGEEP